MSRSGRGITVLLVGAQIDQFSTVVSDLAGAEGVGVEVESELQRARDRLAWPDVDAVVVTGSGEFDPRALLDSIADTYPRMPAYVLADDAVEVDAPVFSPDETDALADAITERIARRDERRTLERFDDGGAEQYPNVDEEDVERLLAGEIEREEAADLLHKQQLVETLFESIPGHLFVKDRAGRHRYVSERYFEENPEVFLDQADPEIPHVARGHAWRAYEDDRYVIDEGEEILGKEEYLPSLDKWNYTSKVPWYHGDEIVGLLGVSYEVTERKERRAEVEHQNERLREFAQVVSHDLRNPLQVATSAIELARSTDDPDSETLSTAANALERMDALIDDVLMLAKYGQSVIDPEPIDLAELATQAWGMAGDPASDLVVDDDLRRILGDEGHVSQLLENLFHNCIEHGTEDTGGVVVRIGPIYTDGERVGFYVEDDGIGIPPDLRDSVFESGFSTAADGTGFGLSIVEEVATAHGWSIGVTESHEGGARFEISGVDVADEN